MTELENLKREKFILDCKDHWNAKDWDYATKLDRQIFELDPPKPKPKKVWYEIYQTFENGIFEYYCRTFGFREDAEKWISERRYPEHYFIKEV